MHRHGCALMCQITHMGHRTLWNVEDWLPPIAPSPIREHAHRSFPKEMDRSDIRRVVRAFGDAAARCREGGLDGVELLAYGHLIHQFWTPLVNRRTDEYGGSLANRARFGLEVLEEVRRRVGDDFPVGFRMMGDELKDGGLDQDDCLALAKIYADTGMCDFMNVVAGQVADERGLSLSIPSMAGPRAPFVHVAARMKRETGLAVFHATRIMDLPTAEHCVREGLVDMVAMTRAHMADPHIVAKMMRGEEERIRPCVGAGYCIDRIYVGGDALCLHNPATGRERTMPHVIAAGNRGHAAQGGRGGGRPGGARGGPGLGPARPRGRRLRGRERARRTDRARGPGDVARASSSASRNGSRRRSSTSGSRCTSTATPRRRTSSTNARTS